MDEEVVQLSKQQASTMQALRKRKSDEISMMEIQEMLQQDPTFKTLISDLIIKQKALKATTSLTDAQTTQESSEWGTASGMTTEAKVWDWLYPFQSHTLQSHTISEGLFMYQKIVSTGGWWGVKD